MITGDLLSIIHSEHWEQRSWATCRCTFLPAQFPVCPAPRIFSWNSIRHRCLLEFGQGTHPEAGIHYPGETARCNWTVALTDWNCYFSNNCHHILMISAVHEASLSFKPFWAGSQITINCTSHCLNAVRFLRAWSRAVWNRAHPKHASSIRGAAVCPYIILSVNRHLYQCGE
jgi:hypothetical protein